MQVVLTYTRIRKNIHAKRNTIKEGRKLIKRNPNPEDGRGVIINLTEKGLEKREDSRQRVFTFNDRIKSEIESEKLSHFYNVTETILDLINDKKIF